VAPPKKNPAPPPAPAQPKPEDPGRVFGRWIGGFLLATAIVAAGFILVRGRAASANEIFIFIALTPVPVTLLIFEGIRRKSTATFKTQSGQVGISLSGAAACYAALAWVLWLISPAAQMRSINFVIQQGSGVYKNPCTIDWQAGSASRRTDTVQSGGMTITEIPADVSEITIFGVEAVGKNYTPKGFEGKPPPWKIKIDGSSNVTITLPDEKTSKAEPPTPDEMKKLLTGWKNLDPEKIKTDLEIVKTKNEKIQNDETREANRLKAFLKIYNKTFDYVHVIGLDCKKLWTPSDEFSFEDSDWEDFVELPGTKSDEFKTYWRFRELKGTSGQFCVYGCIKSPEGLKPIYLGVFDFLEHEKNVFTIEKNGSKDQPIVLVPGESGGNK
jgi:hypothetical protein